ncbi:MULTISPECIES: eCIS core domain-containing protein [unclassified Streptomyces]|uniref:eCIS core domain-containing protein n=1 Tax=unclassified Streptomyces TaxID=2593676 RepID=UPI00081F238C|nr:MULTISPECIES: DUF4157 domain-containing protein [unclassified Streptomyces]MYR93373.1 DUF4157 domain-containing protein [Streptomyces sp. SID4937]SCD51500.1 protein of unknown function [Streptomyces sp. ScaeMP-e83]
MHTPARGSSTDVRAERAARARQVGEGPERLPSGVPGVLHQLQRALGNAAVAQLVAREREEPEERGGGEDRPVQRAMAHQVLRSPGRPIQEPLRRGMESRLGADFSAVRIHADAVAQRSAGNDPLAPDLPAEEPRAEELMSRWKALTRTQPDPGGVVMAEVRAAVADYDSDTRRDPVHCLTKLMEIQMKIAEARTGASDAVLAFLQSARRVVDAEFDVVAHQSERDNDLPAQARGPFQAMTDTGMLWNRTEWPDSAPAFGMQGASYFRELSELNRAGMAKEIAGRGTQDWVAGVGSRLTAGLNQSVLCHYTSAPRAAQMATGGRMKSKSELLRDDPDAENNSEAYDKHGLANEGFVFFFLEVPGSPFRDTRFSNGEAARIEIRLTDSPS